MDFTPELFGSPENIMDMTPELFGSPEKACLLEEIKGFPSFVLVGEVHGIHKHFYLAPDKNLHKNATLEYVSYTVNNRWPALLPFSSGFWTHAVLQYPMASLSNKCHVCQI